MLPIIAAFFIAFLTCLGIVPFAKLFALKTGIVDAPDKKRKLHGKTIPLAGGIAVFLSMTLAIGLVVLLNESFRNGAMSNFGPAIGLFVACAIILGIGVVDDRFGMRGRQKLAGQIIAVGILIAFGYKFDAVNLLGFDLHIQVLGIVVVGMWLLGTINAVNLIDGADGLASTIGIIVSASIVFMAFESHPGEAVIAAALTGALVGFLIYNFPPASVFLGDAGSMLIGLLVGVLAIRCSLKSATTFTMIAPVALLAIPMFDSVAAIVRRRLTGRSIYTTDRGHLHHRLMERGMGPRIMLVWVASLCSITGLGAYLSVTLNSDWIAIASVVAVITFLIAGRIFGFAEFRLISSRALNVGRSVLVSPMTRNKSARETTVRLQGSRNWSQLWEALTEFADDNGLAQVSLDLNLPWLHEGYHAMWERSVSVEANESWQTSLPLTAGGTTYGRIEIAGPLTKESIYMLLSLLADLLETMEPIVVRLASEEKVEEKVEEEKFEQLPLGGPTQAAPIAPPSSSIPS